MSTHCFLATPGCHTHEYVCMWAWCTTVTSSYLMHVTGLAANMSTAQPASAKESSSPPCSWSPGNHVKNRLQTNCQKYFACCHCHWQITSARQKKVYKEKAVLFSTDQIPRLSVWPASLPLNVCQWNIGCENQWMSCFWGLGVCYVQALLTPCTHPTQPCQSALFSLVFVQDPLVIWHSTTTVSSTCWSSENQTWTSPMISASRSLDTWGELSQFDKVLLQDRLLPGRSGSLNSSWHYVQPWLSSYALIAAGVMRWVTDVPTLGALDFLLVRYLRTALSLKTCLC